MALKKIALITVFCTALAIPAWAQSSAAQAPERPVFMIFSAHASRRDGVWTAHRLEKYASKSSLTLWLEQAFPQGAPDLERLQQLFPDTDWSRELAQNLSAPALAKLRRSFDAALANQGTGLFAENQDAFLSEVLRLAERLRRRGRDLNLRVERPCFEAYLYDLKRQAWARIAQYWMNLGRHDKALAATAVALEYELNGIRLRDGALALLVARERAASPSRTQVVLRGLAHIQTLPAFFKDSPARSILEPGGSALQRYVRATRRLPSLDTAEGADFLKSQLETNLP